MDDEYTEEEMKEMNEISRELKKKRMSCARSGCGAWNQVTGECWLAEDPIPPSRCPHYLMTELQRRKRNA